jgi:hypothetical protein
LSLYCLSMFLLVFVLPVHVSKTMEAIVIGFDVSAVFSVSSVYINPSKKSLKMPKW